MNVGPEGLNRMYVVHMRHRPWLGLLAALALGACGGATANEHPDRPAAEASAGAQWTAALLRKLDTALRDHVRDGASERLAVKVHFRRIPDEEELANLLLSRVGDQVVGRVQEDVLWQIAARDDVDRIEQLTDVGY